MENEFLLITKIQDKEKLRRFEIGKFNKLTENILKKNQSKHIWGVHKGVISDSTWNKLKKNDKIYFAIEKENFRISGILTKKIKNLKFGEILYPELIDKKQINYFLLFDKLDVCNISYSKLVDYSKYKIRLREGLFEIDKKYAIEKPQKSVPKKFSSKEKILGPAKRSKSEIYRFIRNQGKVKDLKNLYENKCQICDYTFEHNVNKSKGFYSEVHHYNPLKKQADDDLGNMIVLCPNHHAEFDYGVKFIDLDEVTIIDNHGNKTGETIQFHKNHKLDRKNIESQLE